MNTRFPNFWPIFHLCLWLLVTFRLGLYAGLWLALAYGLLLLLRWTDKLAKRHGRTLLQRMPAPLRTALPLLRWPLRILLLAAWLWLIHWQLSRGDDVLLVIIQHGMLLAVGINHYLHRQADKRTRIDSAS